MIDEISGEQGAEVIWDEPLTDERRG